MIAMNRMHMPASDLSAIVARMERSAIRERFRREAECRSRNPGYDFDLPKIGPALRADKSALHAGYGLIPPEAPACGSAPTIWAPPGRCRLRIPARSRGADHHR